IWKLHRAWCPRSARLAPTSSGTAMIPLPGGNGGGSVMRRWAVAGAGLAVAALVLVAVTGKGSPDAGGNPGKGQMASAPTRGSPMSHPVSRATAPARTTIALPSVPADGTRPLRLTRAMLEQARQDGRLDVHLPGGERFSVTLEADRLAPGDQWTVVGRVQTRLGPQAMVLTSGPDAIFGVLPLPDGSMMQVTTTRGRTEIAPAGDMLPPGNKDARVAGPDYLVPPAAPDDRLAAKASSRGAPSAQPPKSSSPVDIDVLGLYTGDLVELRGSV